MPIDDDVVEAVIYQESRHKANAISPKGARGLMQLTDVAWKDVQAHHPELSGLEYEKYWQDPDVNRQFGTRYLNIVNGYLPSTLRGSLPHILAAYNGGIGRLKKTGYEISRMPKETRDYVQLVGQDVESRRKHNESN